MPVPACDVDRNPPGLKAASDQSGNDSPEENDDPSEQMQPVQPSEEVIELTAGTTAKIDSLELELAPGTKLTDDKGAGKQKTENLPGDRFSDRGACNSQPFIHDYFLTERSEERRVGK